ncbi:MAG: amidohydrolase [Candidatus Kapaibacterium sp.]
MISFQGDIYIKDGIISDLSPGAGYVRIISEGLDRRFENAWAYPGIVDTHGHIGALGARLTEPDLSQARSAELSVGIVSDSGITRGDWIYARGWNQELWHDNSFPDKYILDKKFGDSPAFFVRIDGHAAWVNSAALRLAGISSETNSPPGGEILRDKNGRPTGILLDTAMDLVRRLIPDYAEAQIEEFYRAGLDACADAGLTEVHAMDVSPERLELLKRLDERGELPIRLQCYIKAQEDEWRIARVEPFDGEMLSVRGLKFYADGALGSRGAAMIEPYSDAPGSSGLLLINPDVLYTKALKGVEMGFDIAVHAIGDAANRMVLDVYHKIRRQIGFNSKNILRIEHAQHVHPDDLPLFAEIGVIPSVHPMHCITDAATMTRRRLGNRCDYAYPWKSFINAGVNPAGGSDFPIEPHNPLTGIDAFVRRAPAGSNEAWYPEERLSRREALLAYTYWAHAAAGNSSRRGSIEKNMDADITILDKDIISCGNQEINETQALGTTARGKLREKNN